MDSFHNRDNSSVGIELVLTADARLPIEVKAKNGHAQSFMALYSLRTE